MRGNNFYNLIARLFIVLMSENTYTAASFLNLYNVCIIALIPVVVFPLLTRLTSILSASSTTFGLESNFLFRGCASLKI
jgi:hypothetical protein